MANAYGAPDFETGTITIVAEPRSRLSTQQRDHLLSELRSLDPESKNPHFSLVVQFGRVQFEQLHHYRGGAHGHFPGSGNWCTWGFNVVPTSGGGGHGLVTARHCDDATSATGRYHAHGSGSSGTLTKVRHGPYSRGDMAFYRTSGHLVDGNRFYYDYQSYRTATAVAPPTINLRLCAYGRTGGNRCNMEVDQLYVQATVNGVTVSRLARTSTSRSQNGDSGGPWYSSGTAYGITTGVITVSSIFGPRSHDVFTPASPYFVDHLQVRVRTG